MADARTRRRPAELRALLLAAAERVFAEHGYVAATAEQIAAEAGVSRSVLYRHFDGKPELFREAVLAPFFAFLREFRDAWRSQEETPWEDERLMRTMVGLFHDAFADHRDTLLTIALSADALDADSHAVLDRELDRFFAEMRLISSSEMDRRPWMSDEQLDLSIRLTLGSIAASVALSRVFLPTVDPPPRDVVVDHITKLTLYGLRLAPPQAASS